MKNKKIIMPWEMEPWDAKLNRKFLKENYFNIAKERINEKTK